MSNVQGLTAALGAKRNVSDSYTKTDINGYLKITDSTSLEAEQNEFKFDTIETSDKKEKDKSKKGRPKIDASN